MSAEPRRRYEPAYFLDQIAEYMARGMSPERARAEAYLRFRNVWLNKNSPPRTPYSTCVHCGYGERLGEASTLRWSGCTTGAATTGGWRGRLRRRRHLQVWGSSRDQRLLAIAGSRPDVGF